MSVDLWDLALFGGIVLLFAALLAGWVWSEHRRAEAPAAAREEASEHLRALLQPPRRIHPEEGEPLVTTSEIPPVPEGAKPVPNPCPRCHATALHIEGRLNAQPAGTYSLAGAQPKVAATYWPVLVCRACGRDAPARSYDPAARDGRGELVFEPSDMATPEERDEHADRVLEEERYDRMFPPREEPDWEEDR